MATQSSKGRYLLPGESDQSLNRVKHHGIYQKFPQNDFLMVPRIYDPREGDFVLGIVIIRAQDLFLIDINSVEAAILPTQSFEHGCCPNRNTMNRLSVVYARVVRNQPWTQTELSCLSLQRSGDKTKSKFGQIDEGHILRCSLALCAKLKRSPLIDHLQRLVQNFRIIITSNGFIWYNAHTVNAIIAVKNVLFKHEIENDIERLLTLYQTLMNKLQQQDDSLIKVKQQQQQQPIKKDPEIKQTKAPTTTSNVVANLTQQVIQSILNKMIDEIEKEVNSSRV